MILENKILWGTTRHHRNSPKAHKFSYKIFFFYLELEKELSKSIFSFNRFNIYSIFNKDYVDTTKTNIRDKITAILSARKLHTEVKRIFLITMPRYFGYVFNPVSFYLLYNENNKVEFLLCEVCNTFGEKFVYTLKEDTYDEELDQYHYSFEKEFFVSPFLQTGGEYTISLIDNENEFYIEISLSENQQEVFKADFRGKKYNFTNKNLLITFFKYLNYGLFVMYKIHKEAFFIVSNKKAQIFKNTNVLDDTNSFPLKYNYSIFYLLRVKILNFFKSRL